MRIAPLPVFIALLITAGCATTGTIQVSRGQELLGTSQSVISSLNQLSYQQMGFEEPVTFAFDEKSAVLQEGDERRFVKGFVLPEGERAYSVSITSYKMGTLNDPAIMYPEVRILDRNYRVVRTLPHTSFVFRPSRSEDGLGTVFFVNGNAQGESFLVVENRRIDEAELITSQSNVTGYAPVVVPFPGGFAMWHIPTGSSTPPIKMKASPTGQLKVELREYRPRRVGE